MTKKEKATRRYIFRELRRNAMVQSVRVETMGRLKNCIVFFLDIDGSGILSQLLKMKGERCYVCGHVLPGEVTFYSTRPRAELRENLHVKIYHGFLGYEDLLINSLEELLEIPENERMGSG